MLYILFETQFLVTKSYNTIYNLMLKSHIINIYFDLYPFEIYINHLTNNKKTYDK